MTTSKKTPGESVRATRLVARARRKGFGRDAGEGVVFFGGAERRKTAGGKNKLTCSFVAEATSISVSADVPVDVVSHALLVYWRSTILSGTKPTGQAPQVKLSQATLARGDRLTPYRGAATGHLGDNLRRGQITGTTTRARCAIMPPSDRNVFVALELKRNIRYIGLGGEVDEVIRLAVQSWLVAAVAGTAREAEPGALVAEKADR